MFRKLLLTALAAGMFVSVCAPKTASACPQICIFEHGHWHCGCA